MTRFRRVAMVFVTCAVLTVATTSTPAGAASGRRTWKSGVFAGYGGSGDAAFAQWRSAPLQTSTDYTPSDNWAEIENPSWSIAQWQTQTSTQVVLSVALFPPGGTLAQAATGAYNSHFVALAKNLLAGGLKSVILRLGWEFNLNYYPWSVATTADAVNFARAWRQIVVAIRSVHGQAFGFDWCPSIDATGIDPGLAFPGAAYLSDIGLDVYDWNRIQYATAAQRWSAIVNNGYGLAWQARMATTYRKPIAFAEWGLVSASYAPGWGGGDDPAFIQNMYSWFGSHNTAFENYFDADSSYGLDIGINTGNGLFPQAAATYESLYANEAYTG